MTKYQVQDIFSFNRLKTLNTNYTGQLFYKCLRFEKKCKPFTDSPLIHSDLQHTSLYVSDPLCPKLTKPLFNCHSHEKKLLYKSGIITCLDYETLEYILDSIKMAPGKSLALLSTGFEQHVDIICITLDTNHYIARSIRINMDWCRRMWSLSCREHMIAVTGVYYSVLGGAYCSLGKSNSKYVRLHIMTDNYLLLKEIVDRHTKLVSWQ